MSPTRSVAAVGRLLADDHPEQRGLARAVGADDPDDPAGRQAEGHVLDEEPVAVALLDAVGLDDQVAQVRAGRDLEDDRLVAPLGGLAGQLLVTGDPGAVLGHAGPGGHPDPLQLSGEGLPAVALLLLFLGQAILLLLEPGGVVALPGDALAPVELEDPAGDVVEEVAVVGDGDDRAGIILEVALEPGDRLGVEVVGGLVEEEDVGAFEQGLAERDPALLAAGEGRDVGVAGREPHGVHGDLDVAVEVPGVGRVDGVLDPGLLVEQLLHLVGVERLAELGVDLDRIGSTGPGSWRRPARRCPGRRAWGRASAPAGRSRSSSRAAGLAVPTKSLSTPAMILRSVLLPAPLPPSTPILAPG